MENKYMIYKISGLENCILTTHEITEYNCSLFKTVVIKFENDSYITYFELADEVDNHFICNNYQIVTNKGKYIIRMIIRGLIEQEFAIKKYQLSEPSFSFCKGKHIKAYSSVTVNNIDTGVTKKQYNNKKINLGELNDNDNKDKIVSLLEISDEVVRYEMLYQMLKNACGRQIDVTEKIRKGYSETIACNNRNIDPKFWGSRAEWQDDFTYLRTLISHGRKEHAVEIYERLERDTYRLVKILYDLY